MYVIVELPDGMCIGQNSDIDHNREDDSSDSLHEAIYTITLSHVPAFFLFISCLPTYFVSMFFGYYVFCILNTLVTIIVFLNVLMLNRTEINLQGHLVPEYIMGSYLRPLHIASLLYLFMFLFSVHEENIAWLVITFYQYFMSNHNDIINSAAVREKNLKIKIHL